MAIDIQTTFRSGGRKLIDLLEYCVRSMQFDALFLFLTGEFREHPTDLKALALYDGFCAPQAVARIRAEDVLPPKNLRILADIQPLVLRRQVIETGAGARGEDEHLPRPLLPPKFLFDYIVLHLEQGEGNQLDAIRANYDSRLEPMDNLPGGKMNAVQQHFVDHIWGPKLRPFLVAAGFRRIANIA